MSFYFSIRASDIHLDINNDALRLCSPKNTAPKHKDLQLVLDLGGRDEWKFAVPDVTGATPPPARVLPNYVSIYSVQSEIFTTRELVVKLLHKSFLDEQLVALDSVDFWTIVSGPTKYTMLLHNESDRALVVATLRMKLTMEEIVPCFGIQLEVKPIHLPPELLAALKGAPGLSQSLCLQTIHERSDGSKTLVTLASKELLPPPKEAWALPRASMVIKRQTFATEFARNVLVWSVGSARNGAESSASDYGIAIALPLLYGYKSNLVEHKTLYTYRGRFVAPGGEAYPITIQFHMSLQNGPQCLQMREEASLVDHELLHPTHAVGFPFPKPRTEIGGAKVDPSLVVHHAPFGSVMSEWIAIHRQLPQLSHVDELLQKQVEHEAWESVDQEPDAKAVARVQAALPPTHPTLHTRTSSVVVDSYARCKGMERVLDHAFLQTYFSSQPSPGASPAPIGFF